MPLGCNDQFRINESCRKGWDCLRAVDQDIEAALSCLGNGVAQLQHIAVAGYVGCEDMGSELLEMIL